MLNQVLLSLQVKRWAIITYKRICFTLPLLNMRPFADDHLEGLEILNSIVLIVDIMLQF